MMLEVDGVGYMDFVAADAHFRMDSLSDTFSFQATAEDAVPLPFRGGEKCKVSVDGEEVLNGHLELINVDGGASAHTVSIQGRDRTGDLLDSAIGPLSDLQVGDETSLKQVIEAVVKHLNLSLTVTDLTDIEPFLKSEDTFAPKVGQNAFAFIQKAARKRQVFVVSTVSGDLAIVRASGDALPGVFLQHLVDSNANNLLTYSMTYDQTGRFNLYRAQAQSNALARIFSGAPIDVGSLANNKGESVGVTDSDIRQGRQMILSGETIGGAGSTSDRALWESNIRRARGRTFAATVSGYRNQVGELWKPNTLIQVDSDFAGIHDQMLINGVRFTLDSKQGSNTQLSLVEKDAYTLSLMEPQTKTKGQGLEAIFG